MIWYSNAIHMEVITSTEHRGFVIKMVFNYGKQQAEYLNANKAKLAESFAYTERSAINAIKAADPEVRIGVYNNTEDPAKGTMFGTYRVTIRTEWAYPAITTALVRWRRQIKHHAQLSGYNSNGSRRRKYSRKEVVPAEDNHVSPGISAE